MTKIAIISLSDLSRDPRVSRQISTLYPKYEIISAGTRPYGISIIPFFKLIHNGKKIYQRAMWMELTKKYDSFYWKYANFVELGSFLRQEQPDIIIANDIDMLPVAIWNKGKAKILLDAHEYSPLENDESLIFRLFLKPYRTWLVNTYIPKADSMMTVSEGIAEKYFADTGKRPIVVTNSPDYKKLIPSPVNPDKIRLVHHGAALSERNLELNINIMKYLHPGRYELHLYLVPTDSKYLNRLKKIASIFPNIYFHDPVPMVDLADTINRYDIGIYLLEEVNFNTKHALPNKFFEFIQARLALAIGPSPEMAKIVKTYNIGIVNSDYQPQTLAKRIECLTPEIIQEYKRNSDLIAYSFSSERNKEIISGIVSDLIHD